MGAIEENRRHKKRAKGLKGKMATRRGSRETFTVNRGNSLKFVILDWFGIWCLGFGICFGFRASDFRFISDTG